MSFAIEKLKTKVDREYVGIRLNTEKVKPVHIANGLFRSTLGAIPSTQLLYRFVFHQTQKGVVPRGHDIDSLLAALRSSDAIGQGVTTENVKDFRIALKRLLSADNAVYDKQMQSYSTGHKSFVTKDTVGQDAGEFIGSWLARIKSPLAAGIRSALECDADVLSMLCKPLVSNGADKPVDYETDINVAKLKCSQQMLKGRERHALWKGMESAATTLSKHMGIHPDKLFRLRMAVMFSSLVVLRHITLLESYYESSSTRTPLPLLIDFGRESGPRLCHAAKQSFARCIQSIARFYASAFGEELKKLYSAAELLKLRTPTYKEGQKKKRDDEAASEIWNSKRQAASDSRDKYRLFGEAVYDILAIQAESDPIKYFRGLGRRIGLLYPPNGVAIPWFAARQDLLEMLVYCAIEPGEVILVPQLCRRLWERFGIVIGGMDEDESLLESHSILNWDRDSLRGNCESFSDSLVRLNLATELADGVMKVAMEAHSS
ncbi:MAG: hypothetical protein AB7O62_05545 [Pirellulales bacterium]